MRVKNQNNMRETKTEFIFAMLLMNVLLLSVISAAAWLMRSVLIESVMLNAILRGEFLQ